MERFDKRLASWRNFFYPRRIGLCKHVFWGKGENGRITLAMSVVQFPCIFHVDPRDFGIGTEEIIENIQREILMGCVCVDELGTPSLLNYCLCIRKLFLWYGCWSL